jgi:GNAT superfamily N-acetyltransferase
MVDEQVRPATTDDIEAIQSVAEAGWTAAYDAFLESETIQTAMEEWYDSALTHESINHDDIGYFVAEREGPVVGFASVTTADEPAVASLGALYVAPEHWRSGIGSGLLDRAEAWAQKRGATRLHLGVIAENDIGVSFYRTRGYEQIDELETDLFGETVSECRFQKHLK